METDEVTEAFSSLSQEIRLIVLSFRYELGWAGEFQFYSTLFGQKPAKIKDDYAKWLFEDPRINFAISTRVEESGVDHLGFQVDEDSERRWL